jgi:hypothetical protein
MHQKPVKRHRPGVLTEKALLALLCIVAAVTLAIIVRATSSRGAECTVPVPCPVSDGAAYELKIQTRAQAGATLVVPDLGLSIQTPFNPFPIEIKRLVTPACTDSPGVTCPDFNGVHLAGMSGWPLPALSGVAVTVNSPIFGQVVLKPGAPGFVFVDATKSLTGEPGGAPFDRIYACWGARLGGKSAKVPYKDQFGAQGIAALKRVSYVCFAARYDQAEGLGTFLATSAKGAPLPDQYFANGVAPLVNVRLPFVQGLQTTQLEGLDEWLESVTLVSVVNS